MITKLPSCFHFKGCEFRKGSCCREIRPPCCSFFSSSCFPFSFQLYNFFNDMLLLADKQNSSGDSITDAFSRNIFSEFFGRNGRYFHEIPTIGSTPRIVGSCFCAKISLFCRIWRKNCSIFLTLQELQDAFIRVPARMLSTSMKFPLLFMKPLRNLNLTRNKYRVFELCVMCFFSEDAFIAGTVHP